jgi:hypothetical protein
VSAGKYESDLMSRYHKQLAVLKENFKKVQFSFALTSDIWTSSHQKTSYISVVAHYLDNSYCLHKRVIGFRVMYRPANGKKSNPLPPIPKSNYFDIHPTPNQKYYREVKPNPSNNIIDPKPTRNWVETHGKPVGLAYCLTSSQLHTHFKAVN